MIEWLPILSTLVLGLFAGSLLTEAIILVPYWRRMPAEEFFRLHHTLGPHLFRYFAPLTSLAVALSIIVAVLHGNDNRAWLLTAVLCAIALAVFFVYFRAANNKFAERKIDDKHLNAELARWSAWHWFRTVLVILALGLSVAGHA